MKEKQYKLPNICVYQISSGSTFKMMSGTVRTVVETFKFIKPFTIGVMSRNCNYLMIDKKGNTNYASDKFVDFFRNNERYSQLILNYKENNSTANENVENSVTLLEKYKINSNNYRDVLYFLHNLNYGKDINYNKVSGLLFNADEQCSKELCNLSRELVYKSIDVWYSLYQGNIVKQKVYWQFLNTASTWLQYDKSKMEEIVYIMFYASLLKNSPMSQRIIKMCLTQIERSVLYLCTEELSIVINSSFKASVKIKSKNFLKHISLFATENLKYLVQEPVYLVAVVKGLRLSNYQDFSFLDAIGNANYSGVILKMKLIAKIHILALYADAVYNKKHFVQALIQSCLNDLNCKNADLSEISSIRLKDISTLLWAVGYLSHNISPKDLMKIIDILQTMMDEKRKKNADQLVSCLLSLWMLGNKSPALFNTAVLNNLIQSLKERNVFRSISRLCLLLTSIQIEMPELLLDDLMKWNVNNIIPPRAEENQLKKRECLQYIYTAIKNLSENLNTNVICGCFIPNLNVLGITVQSPNGKIMHIEVLDSTTCLHDTSKPHGIMKLKIRLLKFLGHQVVIIPENKFCTSHNFSELYVFLEEKLQKLKQVSSEHPVSENK